MPKAGSASFCYAPRLVPGAGFRRFEEASANQQLPASLALLSRHILSTLCEVSRSLAGGRAIPACNNFGQCDSEPSFYELCGHLARLDFSAQIQDAADLSRPHVSASVVKQLFPAADKKTIDPTRSSTCLSVKPVI